MKMASQLIDTMERKGIGGWTGVGCRVVRGMDWMGGNADGLDGGTGKGTVMRGDGKSGVVAVKWDNSNYGFYKMGADGKFELKPAPLDIVSTDVDLKDKTLVEESESEYEESDYEEADIKKIFTQAFDTDHACEVCGSIWTEKVKSASDEAVVFRCIKHRRGWRQ